MIRISTDKALLDRSFIHNFIAGTYWAKGRTPEEMNTCIDNSYCFGIYLDEKQIGFARVVSDFMQFAYLMDLFVSDEFRGQGYSKELMERILNDEKLKTVKVWRLSTADAHGLYTQFGFTPLKNPENMMELILN